MLLSLDLKFQSAGPKKYVDVFSMNKAALPICFLHQFNEYAHIVVYLLRFSKIILQTKQIQSLTIAIVFELIYYTNGHF